METVQSINAKPRLLVRVLGGLRVVYSEMQYWLIGMTPEGYHWAKASAWEDLGNYHRAAKHWAGYLKNSENPKIRAQLAYCHARNSRWSEAAVEYTKALASWSHPSLILALAEAKLQIGDTMAARELLDALERDHSPLQPGVQQALAYLRANMDAASNQSAERA
jgi:hypothetical protein